MPKKRRNKYEYHVLKAVGGGQQVMKKFKSKKDAVAYYNKHPKAFGIQRYNVYPSGSKISSGLTQPGVPHTVKKGKTTYRRAYVGPHTKAYAQKVAKSFNKEGKLKAVARKFKKGWFIYVH